MQGFAGGLRPGVQHLRPPQACAQREAAPQRLAQTDEVGVEAERGPGEHAPAAAEAGEYLVGHHNRPVPAGEVAQFRKEPPGRDAHPSAALHRLHQHRTDRGSGAGAILERPRA